MKCDKCKKKFEELICFTKYYLGPLGIDDDKWYCDTCFKEKEKHYLKKIKSVLKIDKYKGK